MATFEEMRTLYDKWAATRWDRYTRAVQFTKAFKSAFSRQISAPTSYEDLDGIQRNYIDLVRLHPLDENLKYKIDNSDKASSRFDGHITEEEDDGLIFGISVIIDRAENSWPKEIVNFFRISFRPRSGLIELKIFLQIFKIDMEDPSTWKPALDYMEGNIVKTLTTFEPHTVEEDEASSYNVGFIAPQINQKS